MTSILSSTFKKGFFDLDEFDNTIFNYYKDPSNKTNREKLIGTLLFFEIHQESFFIKSIDGVSSILGNEVFDVFSMRVAMEILAILIDLEEVVKNSLNNSEDKKMYLKNITSNKKTIINVMNLIVESYRHKFDVDQPNLLNICGDFDDLEGTVNDNQDTQNTKSSMYKSSILKTTAKTSFLRPKTPITSYLSISKISPGTLLNTIKSINTDRQQTGILKPSVPILHQTKIFDIFGFHYKYTPEFSYYMYGVPSKDEYLNMDRANEIAKLATQEEMNRINTGSYIFDDILYKKNVIDKEKKKVFINGNIRNFKETHYYQSIFNHLVDIIYNNNENLTNEPIKMRMYGKDYIFYDLFYLTNIIYELKINPFVLKNIDVLKDYIKLYANSYGRYSIRKINDKVPGIDLIKYGYSIRGDFLLNKYLNMGKENFKKEIANDIRNELRNGDTRDMGIWRKLFNSITMDGLNIKEICNIIMNPTQNIEKIVKQTETGIKNLKNRFEKSISNIICFKGTKPTKQIEKINQLKFETDKETHKKYVVFNSFVSTSVEIEVAKEFAKKKNENGKGNIFVIFVPKETDVLFMTHSEFIEENEILLKPKTKLEIIHQYDSDRKDDFIYYFCLVV